MLVLGVGGYGAPPNNSFNPSGISMAFIVNLCVAQLSPAGLIRALDCAT